MPTTPDKLREMPPQPLAAHGPLKASALRLGRFGRRVLFGVVLAGGGMLALAALAWGALLFEILPRIDVWRSELADQATRSLGVPVRIGKVAGRADGMWPVLSLRDVQLLDKAGRVALRLPEVTARVSLATLSPRALADRELRLSELALVGPELDVRRDASGDLYVAGIPLARRSGKPNEGGLADWVLSQAQIRISQGTVRWTDELLGAPTLALSGLDLALHNGWGLGRRVHELTIEATPPAAFGQRFALRASMAQPLWMMAGVPVREGEKVPWLERWHLDGTRPAQWETWSGLVGVDLPHVDVRRLKQHVRLPIDIEGGQGALKAELSVGKGTFNRFKLDVAVRDVQMRLAHDLAPLAFKRLDGQVGVTHEAEQSALSFRKLSFELDDGLKWPSSSGSFTWRHAPWTQGFSDAVWGLTRGGDAQVDRMDLALLARVIDRLPIPPRARAVLADVAPRGVAEDVSWRWDGLMEAPNRYEAKGRFRGLGWAASDASQRPGLEQADVLVTADEKGGRADLSVRHGAVSFPGVFEDPRIPLDTLDARVSWSVKRAQHAAQPSDLFVDVTGAHFTNADAEGVLEGHWRTGAAEAPDGKPMSRFPGWLDLSGRLERGEATRVFRYLPLAIPKGPREYVRLALHSGHGRNVTFDVEGDLRHFPFKDDAGGHFRVKVPMHEVTLDYVPLALQSPQMAAKMGGWPAFTSLEGELLFEGQRMSIKDARGRLGAVGSGTFALRDVQGRIDDLGSHAPHLTIEGGGNGPLNDLLRFLAQSPVGRWTGNALAQAQSSGSGSMQLALDIPLDHAEDTHLKGAVTLTEGDQANLRLLPSVPEFTALQGTIGFTEKELSVTARTQVWGHAADVEGRRTSDGTTRFVAQGTMSAEGLRQAEEYPLLQKLAEHLSGEAPVTVTVTMGQGSDRSAEPEVQITSSLQGISSSLPSPLNKPALAAWPLKVVHHPEDAQGRNDAILVELGNLASQPGAAAAPPWLRVDLRRDTSGPYAFVSRGTMSLVQPGMLAGTTMPALPPRGVAAQLAVSTIDVDAWQAVARSMGWLDNKSRGGEARAGSAGANAAAAESAAADSYLPDTLGLKTHALVLRQRTLKDVSGTLAHPSMDVWRAQIESQQMAGQFEWLPETVPLATGPGSTRVIARLSHLSVPQADAQAIEEEVTEQMLSPDSGPLPALDVVVDQFEWRGLPLGRLEVEAINRMTPVPSAPPMQEWRLTRFRMSTPEAQLNASGNWTAVGTPPGSPTQVTAPGQRLASLPPAPKARPRSAFNFTLDLQNSGGLLARLGLPQTIRGGKGKLSGQVSWTGSPLEPDPLSMNGDVNVQISEGQFLKVDPGIAKLLGVLSLQSLPRRLALDFRDVFAQGFAFDSIDGDVKVAQGTATTRNLRMRGVQAIVLMEGQANIAHETQDLHVYVIPEVNAGGASLAYAAINPVVGLGTFIAQMLLRKQVATAGTQEFKVTGSWADPQVERVPTSKVDAAAAAASAAEIKASAAQAGKEPGSGS